MNVEIKLPKYDGQGRAYVTWRPVAATARIVNPPSPAPASVKVRLAAKAGPGGKLSFATNLTHLGADTLDLTLPGNGAKVAFFVGGKFGFPSAAFGDVAIEARQVAPGVPNPAPIGSHPLMVRVRKNANVLTAAERDRFVAAMATLNGAGAGIFKQFRDTHVGGRADQQEHNNFGFLPWHRAFLLDLERELQALDPQVTLPYWRFDQIAPTVITRAFMGVPDANGVAQFNPGHPFLSWVTDGNQGVFRGVGVGPNTVPQPRIAGFRVLTQAQTLALSSGATANFAAFSGMEGTPHGAAHMSNWTGPITSIPTAARDPLFFLLHANVDRLWAMWQWLNRRHDPADAKSYGGAGLPVGHNLGDTLWPWNNVTTAPRPNFAPRHPLAKSPMTAAPAANPRIRDMIDYLGTVAGAPDLAFAYDDVPFEN